MPTGVEIVLAAALALAAVGAPAIGRGVKSATVHTAKATKAVVYTAPKKAVKKVFVHKSTITMHKPAPEPKIPPTVKPR